MLVGQNNMHSIDLFIQQYFASVRTAGLTEVMYLVSTLFNFSIYFVLLSVCIALLICCIRNIRYMLLFVASLIAGGIIVYILKIILNVPRPEDAVYVAFGQSLPSYHAALVTIFFVMLMYIFDDYFPSLPRIIFNSICTSIILVVSFSRVYLGVHWFSDVIIGILLGSVISYCAIVVFRHVIE